MAYGTVIKGNKADVICRIAFNNAFFFNDRFFNIKCFLINYLNTPLTRRHSLSSIQFFGKKSMKATTLIVK